MAGGEAREAWKRRCLVAGLLESAVPLAASYDVALLDLDGVVYLGGEPIPGVAAALTAAQEAGIRLAYVTNNASRLPAEVVELLRGMGVPVEDGAVITSGQAAAGLLADRLDPGDPVLVVGSAGLAVLVAEAGLRPVRHAADGPVAVVEGFAPETSWRDLAEAAVAVRAGALWVATNVDHTLPSTRGPLPGNGALVAAVQAATGCRPLSVGKPEPELHREAVRRTAAARPLVVGDRLDTDIEGSHRVGADSLLVLTGVTRPVDVLCAPPARRPSYLAASVAGLLEPHPPVRWADGVAHCGTFVASWQGDRLVLGGGRTPAGAPADPVDALRALCLAAWPAADRDPVPVLAVEPSTSGAAHAVSELRLTGSGR